MKKKIESGIPCPQKINNHSSKWLATICQMKSGDSVQVRNRSESNSLAYAMRYHGIIANARKQFDGTYRVWRFDNDIKSEGEKIENKTDSKPLK